MTHPHQPLVPWRAILRGVIIACGLTFMAGLALAVAGITPQVDPNSYPLFALLVGGISVAVALRVIHTTRPICLVGLGVGIWILSMTSVLIGAQSFIEWVESSASIAATVLLGRLLVGASLNEDPVQSPYSTLVRRMTQTHRQV